MHHKINVAKGAAHRVMCEGLPICTAVEHRRPANDAESLAYLYLHVQMDGMPLEQQQQSYVDERKNVRRETEEQFVPSTANVEQHGIMSSFLYRRSTIPNVLFRQRVDE